MKSKRTSVAFLLATFGGLLLFANCTVKTVDGGDTCQKGDTSTCSCGDSKGNQTCTSKGTWGVCECGSVNNNGGSSNNAGGEGNTSGTTNKAGSSNGGTTSNGGTSYAGDATVGGEAPVNGGAGGEGGAGPTIDPADCDSCLQQLCPKQMTACLNNSTCVDQYASISACIEAERPNGLVKRDVVRGCGVTIGANSNPDLQDVWAPAEMDPDTTALINCMAGGMPDAPNADWANDMATNFPNNMPAPWLPGTCAKLACTSMLPAM